MKIGAISIEKASKITTTPVPQIHQVRGARRKTA